MAKLPKLTGKGLEKMSGEKFLKAYQNLPVPEREQTIAIIDGKPYSWNVAYEEILNKTKLGEKILKKLEILGIL